MLWTFVIRGWGLTCFYGDKPCHGDEDGDFSICFMFLDELIVLVCECVFWVAHSAARAV